MNDMTQCNNERLMPPQAIEAEQSLLGSMMIDNRCIADVSAIIEPRDFYQGNHKIIFENIVSLDSRGEPVDIVTVYDSLIDNDDIGDAGGLDYLRSLAQNTPNTGNFEAYANVVREKGVLRRLIESSRDIMKMSYQTEGMTAKEILELAEKLVFEVAQSHKANSVDVQTLPNVLNNVLDNIEYRFKNKNEIVGTPTGFIDIDKKTSGMSGGDLIIVAGRPSMGKTSFAINIAEHVALHVKKTVFVASLEMPSEQIATRILSSISRVDSSRLRNGQLDNEDWPRLTSATGMLQDASLHIDDTPAQTVAHIRSRVRRIAARSEDGIGLIVVDYIQLMIDSGDTRNGNRTEEISNITRGLKALAKEFNCPVVALSQLNRSLEQRPNKRPVMSDLRESGAIEQDADIIKFIYRHEVYEPETDQKGTAEIIIAKQRNGPIGMCRLAFLGQFTKFENYLPYPEQY